jgi:hypothetical protein
VPAKPRPSQVGNSRLAVAVDLLKLATAARIRSQHTDLSIRQRLLQVAIGSSAR